MVVFFLYLCKTKWIIIITIVTIIGRAVTVKTAVAPAAVASIRKRQNDLANIGGSGVGVARKIGQQVNETPNNEHDGLCSCDYTTDTFNATNRPRARERSA